MKGRWRKGFAFMMAGMLTLSMVGCGKNKGTAGGKKADSSQNAKEMVYSGEDFAIDGIKGNISTYFVEGDKIYLMTYEWVEGGASADEGEAAAENGTGLKDEDNVDGARETDEADGSDAGKEDSGEADASDAGKEETDEADASDTGKEDSGEADASDTGKEETDEADASDAGKEDSDETDLEADMDEYEETSVERLYCANLDGSGLKEMALPKMSEKEYMYSMCIGASGNPVYLYGSYDEKTDKQNYMLVETDEKGAILSKDDLTKLLKLSGEAYFNKMCIDGDGNILLQASQSEAAESVYVMDKEKKLLGEVKCDSYNIGGMVISSDGRVLCGMESGEGVTVNVLDVKNLKWGESYKLDLNYFSSSESLMAGEGYGFYYKDDSGIYGYDFDSQKAKKLMDYMASDLSTEDSYNVIPYGADRFLGTSYDYDEDKSKLVLYSKVDPTTIKDKTTVTVGMAWLDEDIRRAAVNFNKKSDTYRIEIKEYSKEEDPWTKMNADFVAGNVPDIICLNNLPYGLYIAKGMLEDLTPYFEKDPEIKESDLLPAVVEAMKVDGKLYYVAPVFQISTMVAGADLVGTEPGWTFAEMMDLLSKQKEGVRPFYSEDKSGMLGTFMWGIGSDFVDWETGECSYDSQEFKDILELCNTGKDGEMDYENSESLPSMIQSGKVLFETCSGGLDEIQLYRKMFNGDITFIGYPNEEKEGSFFDFYNHMAIYSKSKAKDGAWEFLRTFLSKDFQGKSASYAYQIPTRQDAFDMMIKARTATKMYKDEYGNEVTPYSSGWGYDDLSVDIGPSSQEDVDMFKALIDGTKKVSADNDAITEIVQEEAKAYFSGDKSVDETAAIIQNRVKTYVNENR